MANEESPVSKRAKYLHHGSDLAVTEEMMKDFSRDGYTIVKCVIIPRPLSYSIAYALEMHTYQHNTL